MNNSLSAVLVSCPVDLSRSDRSTVPSTGLVPPPKRQTRSFRRPALGMAAFPILVLLGCGGQISYTDSLEQGGERTAGDCAGSEVCRSGDAGGGDVVGTWMVTEWSYSVYGHQIEPWLLDPIDIHNTYEHSGEVKYTFQTDGSFTFQGNGMVSEHVEWTYSANNMEQLGYRGRCDQYARAKNASKSIGGNLSPWTCADAIGGGCTCLWVRPGSLPEGMYKTHGSTITLYPKGYGVLLTEVPMDYSIKEDEFLFSAPLTASEAQLLEYRETNHIQLLDYTGSITLRGYRLTE